MKVEAEVRARLPQTEGSLEPSAAGRGQEQILPWCLPVIAKHSSKQTHEEGQRGQWSAVYYPGGSEAEFPP